MDYPTPEQLAEQVMAGYPEWIVEDYGSSIEEMIVSAITLDRHLRT